MTSNPNLYWPTLGHWQRSTPAAQGLDRSALQAAIEFAVEHESTMNRNIQQALDGGHFSDTPSGSEIIGPTKDRGDPSGVIIRGGQIVAEWGDVHRVDMTFSATKSYLSLCAGIAVDDGLIPDVHAPVRELVDDGGFDGPQNSSITWAHLLQLTSEWQGELWGKPDTIDHQRDLSAKPGDATEKGTERAMRPPGTFWEYNDVRVNRLALALLRVFKRPLPDVLKQRIMDPIGASEEWQWHGYKKFLCRIRCTTNAVRFRRCPLGRWPLDQRAGSCPRRPLDVERGFVERATTGVTGLG